MGPPLRRSRRSTPKQTSSYRLGDVVEVSPFISFRLNAVDVKLTSSCYSDAEGLSLPCFSHSDFPFSFSVTPGGSKWSCPSRQTRI